MRASLNHKPHVLSSRRPAGAARRAFTVLELLIVIGVLSILLAIVLPTIKTVRASVLRNKAQVEATALAQAAIRYKNEYGFWPGQLEVKNTASGAVEVRADFRTANWVSAIISRYENTDFSVSTTGTEPVYIDQNWTYQAFRRVGDGSGNSFAYNPLNPKGIRFLDLAHESDAETVNFPDPWGRQYILVMGLNPRSTFTHTVTPSGGTSPSHKVSVSNTVAFAFSLGADGLQSTNYIYSAGVVP